MFVCVVIAICTTNSFVVTAYNEADDLLFELDRPSEYTFYIWFLYVRLGLEIN